MKDSLRRRVTLSPDRPAVGEEEAAADGAHLGDDGEAQEVLHRSVLLRRTPTHGFAGSTWLQLPRRGAPAMSMFMPTGWGFPALSDDDGQQQVLPGRNLYGNACWTWPGRRAGDPDGRSSNGSGLGGVNAMDRHPGDGAGSGVEDRCRGPAATQSMFRDSITFLSRVIQLWAMTEVCTPW